TAHGGDGDERSRFQKWRKIQAACSGRDCPNPQIMKLYLDDNIASDLLLKLLRKAGHDVRSPSDEGLVGVPDPTHLTRAIRDDRACLTKDHDDYAILHTLLMQAQGKHPGILVVREDNDPSRDLTAKGIVNAIRKLELAGVPIANDFIILNH